VVRHPNDELVLWRRKKPWGRLGRLFRSSKVSCTERTGPDRTRAVRTYLSWQGSLTAPCHCHQMQYHDEDSVDPEMVTLTEHGPALDESSSVHCTGRGDSIEGTAGSSLRPQSPTMTPGHQVMPDKCSTGSTRVSVYLQSNNRNLHLISAINTRWELCMLQHRGCVSARPALGVAEQKNSLGASAGRPGPPKTAGSPAAAAATTGHAA
jgi:hypothetical protein